MDKDSVTAALRALATGSKRSKTAQMRDVFDDVDESLKSGVSREDVLMALNEAGLEISLRTFDTIIYRLRQGRLADSAPVTKKIKVQPASRPDLENGKATDDVTNVLEQIASDDAEERGLSAKQRREKHASKFVDSAATNPLINRIKEKQ